MSASEDESIEMSGNGKTSGEEKNKRSVRKRFKSLSKNDKIKLVSKVLIAVVCIFGLIYQTSVLVAQYSEGQTVVNIRIERIKYIKLPAITVCFPEFISMEKYAKLYPEVKSVYEEYLNLINNVNDTDFTNETLKSNLMRIYKENFIDVKKEYEIPIYDLFDTLSIPRQITEKPETNGSDNISGFDLVVQITAKGKAQKNTNIESIEDIVLKDSSPIESISIKDYYHRRKCYTFFSDLNKKWREYRIELDFITILVHHDKNWFPPNVYGSNTFDDWDIKSLHLSIHSSNSIPDFAREEDWIRIHVRFINYVTFSQTYVNVLPAKHLTNCRDNGLDDKNNENIYMQTDCLSKCVVKDVQKICEKCVYETGSLLRKEIFSKYRSDKYCSYDQRKREKYEKPSKCPEIKVEKIRLICDLKCQKPCEEQFYSFEVKEKTELRTSLWDMSAAVVIRRNQQLDQVVEHLPKMTFIDFFSGFGGLLGIWLGLSAFAILDFILTYF